MSTDTTSSGATRPNPGRANSNGKSARQGERASSVYQADNGRPMLPLGSSRPKSYKEKFQALRETYERVTNTKDRYERDLATANGKIKRLQAECNLLLDAVDIAAPAQATLMHYLSQDPIPPQYHSYQVPFSAEPPPVTAPPPPPPPPPPQPTQPPLDPPVRSRRRSGPHTNGNGVKRKVGLSCLFVDSHH
ncbi:hypothetical protein IEO21_05167 [Rhodonia placenta]|uniref:Uncharacterized protein n=1 Tax=Rhodonia placenta TaxID=104341 RepID=A0A8H7P2E2_9APHY|nr:hypothetical protein IEO21_05167 [Postia placenta]